MHGGNTKLGQNWETFLTVLLFKSTLSLQMISSRSTVPKDVLDC